MKRNKSLYLVMYFTIFGLGKVSLKLTNKKPDPSEVARGEGSCLIFRLIDGDYSTGFSEALESGEVMEGIGEHSFYIDMSGIPKAKKELREAISRMGADQ